MDSATLDTLRTLSEMTGGALAFLLVVLIMRGWLVTKLRHDDTVASYERLLSSRDQEIARLVEDRDWWKDATVAALQIGETAVGRTPEAGDR